jgi:DNA-binding transcriptional ArsR family regulator
VPQDSLESDHCAEMLRALAEPVRLRIIDALRSAPKCVSELSKSLQLEVVTVSHHLGILHSVGLVEREKKGRFKVYRLRQGIVGPANGGQGKQHIDLGCCRLEIPPAAGHATNDPAADTELVQLKGHSPAKRSPSASSKPRIPSA